MKELMARYGGEMVGGRLVAVVDGRKQYLTGTDGHLTDLGLELRAAIRDDEDKAAEAAAAQAAAPVVRRTKGRTVSLADVQVDA